MSRHFIGGRLAAALAVALAGLASAPAWTAALGTPPAATTGSASAITSASATVSGSVDPKGTATSYSFQYGASTGYGAQTATVALGSGTGALPVSVALTALSPDTTYHYRVVATNTNGATNGLDAAFTTGKAPPSATTTAPTAVGSSTATLTATVNPNGLATSYQFQYGLTSAYSKQTGTVSAGAGTAGVGVKAAITGLTPGTKYHYRVIATNPDGTADGADFSFVTAKAAPSATTSSPSIVRSDGAVLTGQVGPAGVATSIQFQYGPTAAYGQTTALVAAGSGTAHVHVSATLSGLAPGTIYHYRLVASSPDGTTVGTDATFITTAGVPAGPARPVVFDGAAAKITSSGAQLNGAVEPNATRTTWYFQYGLGTAYGVQTTPAVMSGLGARPVNVTLGGLAPATTFHFRLVAQTSTTLFVGPDVTFTTKALVRARPAGVSVTASAVRHRRTASVSVSGALRLRAASARGCNGDVEVQILRGADTISLRDVPVAPDCSYRETVTFSTTRLQHATQLGVRARFTGNATVGPSGLVRRAVRL